MKTLITIVICFNLLLTSNHDNSPRWGYSMGQVHCLNASHEYHRIPNFGCMTTTCKFPDKQYYVFLVCDHLPGPRCVSYVDNDKDGHIDLHTRCTDPEDIF